MRPPRQVPIQFIYLHVASYPDHARGGKWPGYEATLPCWSVGGAGVWICCQGNNISCYLANTMCGEDLVMGCLGNVQEQSGSILVTCLHIWEVHRTKGRLSSA